MKEIIEYFTNEVKSEKEFFINQVIENIIEEEEDMVSYASSVTGMSVTDEDDAQDTLKSHLIDLNFDEVCDLYFNRGLPSDYMFFDEKGDEIYLSVKHYTPKQILEDIRANNFKNSSEWVEFVRKLHTNNESKIEIETLKYS